MNYTKPEIVVLGEAARVIEFTGKTGGVTDHPINVNPAYDLDE